MAKQKTNLLPETGRCILASCQSGDIMAQKIEKEFAGLCERLGIDAFYCYLPVIDSRFPDTESCADISIDPYGKDVFIVQSLVNPSLDYTVDENLMALLIAVRAFREYGARRIAAVVPYLAYTRQDKPTYSKRQPVTTRLIAELMACAGLDEIITWHTGEVHIKGLYGGLHFEEIDPVSLFVKQLETYSNRNDAVVVAPDREAETLATMIARKLGIHCAYSIKSRLDPENVEILNIALPKMKFENAIIVDNLIFSAGTVSTVIEKLVNDFGVDNIIACASHFACNDKSIHRLNNLHSTMKLKKVIVTDSIPHTNSDELSDIIKVESIAAYFAQCILKKFLLNNKLTHCNIL